MNNTDYITIKNSNVIFLPHTVFYRKMKDVIKMEKMIFKLAKNKQKNIIFKRLEQKTDFIKQ